MAIVIMAGYPYSGKTEFCKMLTNELDKRNKSCMHITPSNYVSEDYWQLLPEKQREDMISAWIKCTDELTKKMIDSNAIILYDTCGSNSETLLRLIPIMKLNKHQILYVFIASHINECKKRAGDRWIPQEAVTKYQSDFNSSIFKMKKLCNKFFFVKNINDVNKINLKTNSIRVAEAINGEISGVHKPKLVYRSDNRTRQTNNKRTEIRKNRPV
jgi:tRNA uridine 5-carbamoylmethylation protein Kti12